MYTNPSASKTLIDNFFSETGKLFQLYGFQLLKEFAHQNNITIQPNILKNFVQNPFEGLDTKYLTEKAFLDSGYFIKPVAFAIGSTLGKRKVDGEKILDADNAYGQSIPMRKMFS